LILALRRRGYRLLCEGQIPVSRATSLIQPFPRGVEEKTTGGFPPSSFKKTAPLGGKTHPHPCPAAGIFFLEDLFPGATGQAFLVAVRCGTGRVAANPSGLPVTWCAARSKAGLDWCAHFSTHAAIGLNDLHRLLTNPGCGLTSSFGEAESPQWSAPWSGKSPSASGAGPWPPIVFIWRRARKRGNNGNVLPFSPPWRKRPCLSDAARQRAERVRHVSDANRAAPRAAHV
jgi:hypothetical protein